MPTPALAEEQRTRAGRWKMLLVLAVCAAPVVASYFTYFVVRPEGRTNQGELIEPPRPLPASLALTDLAGQAVKPESLQGQWLLVVVAGGACDEACERSLYLQRQLREVLGRDRDRLDKVWLIPDEAPLRPELQAAVEAQPPVQVLRVGREALSQWLAPAPGGTLENSYYLIDPVGRWMLRSPAPGEPSKLKRDLERLLRASASWDRAGR